MIGINSKISISRQCDLLGLQRSTFYYIAIPESSANLLLMRRIDEEYLQHPFYGSRRMAVLFGISRKQAARFMRLMGLEAIYQKPNLSKPGKPSERFPYLLRYLLIYKPNQVWSTDITYIPMRGGFLYLVAIIDWYSRYVITWELSNSLDSGFCIEVLKRALQIATPEIFNNDQGSQFTSNEFVSTLKESGIKISWDGKGRALDNIFVERLWRTVKYEEVYLHEYESGLEAWSRLDAYFKFYNTERPHQSLDYKTPISLYYSKNQNLRSLEGKTEKRVLALNP